MFQIYDVVIRDIKGNQNNPFRYLANSFQQAEIAVQIVIEVLGIIIRIKTEISILSYQFGYYSGHQVKLSGY